MTTASHAVSDHLPSGVKLSICIPTYNRAEYISIAIQSVIDQWLPECMEIVVCDNFSTDNTEAIVSQFVVDYPNIRYVNRERNVGADRNVIEVVDYASGEYFWVLGSDDSLAPGAVNEIMQTIDRLHPDLILGDAFDCDLNLQQTGYLKFLSSEARQFHFDQKTDVMAFLEATTMTASLFGYLSSMVIRRALWADIPFCRHTIGSAYPQVFRALELVFRPAAMFFYLAKPIANNRRNNCGYTAEFGQISRFLIDLRMFRKVIDMYFSDDLAIRNRFKKFVRSCFGRMAQEKIRTGVASLDNLLVCFEEDDKAIPEILHWERLPLVERACQRLQDAGIYQQYLGGESILHIGYRHEGGATLKPVNERAIGIDAGYSGYDGIHLPIESTSKHAVYVSDYFPREGDIGSAVREWFRVLHVSAYLVITNTLDAIEGPGVGIKTSSIISAIETALPKDEFRILYCAQSSDEADAPSEVDIVFVKNRASNERRAESATIDVAHEPATPILPLHDAITQAVNMHAAGNMEQAGLMCRQILAADSNNVTALQLLGLMAYQQGDHVEAICSTTAALAVNPAMIETYTNLGCAYAALGGNAEAIACFTAALTLRPDYADAERNLGVLQRMAVDEDRMRQNFLQIVAAHPELNAAQATLNRIISS